MSNVHSCSSSLTLAQSNPSPALGASLACTVCWWQYILMIWTNKQKKHHNCKWWRMTDDWWQCRLGKTKSYAAILSTDCKYLAHFLMKQDLMLQNLTNLTKLNLTLQYCQPIEKGKLTASEDEAMKMQQIFGWNKMQEKWVTTRCIESTWGEIFYFLGTKSIQNPDSMCMCEVLPPLVQLLWSKIFANASTFIIKLHGNMWNTIYKTAPLQHNSHNTSVQHFMDTTIIPTIYKEDRDQCQQALPCYVIDPWHKLCCKYWGTHHCTALGAAASSANHNH